ncbi:MAG TPA: arylesterase [Pseudacidobacterium sp.]|nr:arylesterase [Pseudacidobacterium sp.]
MDVTRRYFLLFLFTLFAACVFPRAGAADAPVIACFGDSLTAGYGVEPNHTYPDDLQKLLDEHGYHYRVVNKGISGNTSKDGADRLKDVLALHPRIVVLEFGGNDGLRGLPLSATKQNLEEMITTLQKAGIKVLLAGITLPPNYGPDYIQQFNGIYASLAKKYNTPLVPFLLKDVYSVPGSMQEDGIHPTAQGCRQVAANVFEALKPLLRK